MNDTNAEPERGSRERSPQRIAANRRNALKSTGPRTAAGKRRAALNSMARGLFPEDLERQLRVRGEDVNEFRRLHRDLIGIFEPRDGTGERVVSQMAITWWEKARRIRQWVAAGPPRCADLDGRLEQLLRLMVAILARRHEWWTHRLTGVLGGPLGSPAQVRQQIEQRLYVFGARKRNRKYPRSAAVGKKAIGQELPPDFVAYVDKELDALLADATAHSRVDGGQPNEPKRSQMG
jgi:hypothetical protein